MRIAGHDAFAPDETEEEAEHDLADAVALGLVELRDPVESEPVDVFRDEHASGREVCVHARHANVRVVPEQPCKAALVLRFDLVVELIGDPLAHLGQQRSGVRPRRQPLDDRARNPDSRAGRWRFRCRCQGAEPLPRPARRRECARDGPDRGRRLRMGCSSKAENMSCRRASRSCSITRRTRRNGSGSRASTGAPSGRAGTSPAARSIWIIESSCMIFGPAAPIRRSWTPSSPATQPDERRRTRPIRSHLTLSPCASPRGADRVGKPQRALCSIRAPPCLRAIVLALRVPDD